MSETLFEYRCVCMGGETKGKKVAEGKDLQFFLVRDFNAISRENGMRVQIVFPKEFRQLYKHARIEMAANAIGLPDPSKGEADLPTYSYTDLNERTGEDSAPETNSLFISGQGENISCQGRIVFIRPGNLPDVPTSEIPLEDVYVFAINFRHKNKIYYTIVEKGKYIVFDITYPRLLKNLKLNVIRKAGAKPTTVIDHRPENVIKQRKDKTRPAEIILKRNALDSNHVTGSIYVEETLGFNFRLVFSPDQDWNPSEDYILSDESKPRDVAEKDPVEKVRIAEEKAIIKRRKERGLVPVCPYCGRPIAKEAVEARTGIFNCQGKKFRLGTDINFDKENLRKQKKLIFCEAELTKISGGAITANKLVLPEKYEFLPAPKIVTVGYPKSGKTIFLSSLINMKRSGDGIYNSDPFILKEIVRLFAPRFRGPEAYAVNEVIPYGLREVPGAKDTFTRDDRYERDRTSDEGILDLRVKKRFAINVDGAIESQTHGNLGPVLSWNPIGYRLGDLGHMYFYDVPGEYFLPNKFPQLHSIDVADGFIALLDTYYETDDTPQKTKTSNLNLTPAENLVLALSQLQTLSPQGRADLKEVPVAIVLTKIDHHYDEHYDPRNAKFKDVFDPNCHVTQRNMAELFPKNGKYEGSDLQIHIDNSSYEIEEYLKGKQWGKYIDKIKEMFPNVKFFALSALGSDDVLSEESRSSEKEIRYLPSRVRMELPLVWLMVQTGLIRR